MNRLDHAKRIQQEIQELLMKYWDPIGVKDIPEARDEYDSYIPTIYGILIARKSEFEMFNYLWHVETKHMGLD